MLCGQARNAVLFRSEKTRLSVMMPIRFFDQAAGIFVMLTAVTCQVL